MGSPDGVRQCTACRKWGPEALFRSPAGKPTVRCADCRRLRRDRSRASRASRGPAGTRADNLWQKYRITPEEYDALRSAQEHRCRICGVHENDITGVARGRPRLDGTPPAEAFRLVVDHCHRTGQVRGLLCVACNAMIGQARDRPEVLRAAAAYLEAGPGPQPERRSCRLRILDVEPSGRPPRTIRFSGGVLVRLDGYVIRLAPGDTKTVVSPTGEYQLVEAEPEPGQRAAASSSGDGAGKA